MPFSNRPFGELFAEPTRNGLTRPKAVRGAGTKMVNMGELFANSRIANIPMDRVPLTQSEAERSLLGAGDLLFARQSLVLEGAGKCSIFLGDQEPVTFESHVTRVRLNPEEADPRFYFYWLQSFNGRNAIRSIVEQGAGAAGIRGSDLQNLSVIWCPVEVQRQIADILSVLDDKIELNRRMNETLEAMARAIFQSWFVDFDPVRAKASGENPDATCQRLGLTPELLALFPDSFAESELGEIPAGWKVATLRSMTSKIGSGATPRGGREVYIEDGTSLIRSQNVYDSNFDWGGLVRITDEAAQQLSGVAVKACDVLINITGASILRTCVVDPHVLPARVNQHVAIIRAKVGVASRYIHLHLLGVDTKVYLMGLNAGASREAVTKRHLESVPIIDPGENLLERFGKTVASLYAEVDQLTHQGRTLQSLRDTLLPKFLSGELPVDAAAAEGAV